MTRVCTATTNDVPANRQCRTFRVVSIPRAAVRRVESAPRGCADSNFDGGRMITLYEFSPTRSARVRWTLLELGVPFESIEGREVFASAALHAVHPLNQIPAMRDNGRPLFESAALCNWLADSHPEQRLIGAP